MTSWAELQRRVSFRIVSTIEGLESAIGITPHYGIKHSDKPGKSKATLAYLKAFISNNLKTVSAIGAVSLMPLISSSVVIGLLIKYRELYESMATMQWLFVYVATSLTMAFAITPTTFIAICSGYFLGWAATPAVVLSYLAASVIGYLMGARLDGGKLINSLKDYPKVRAISMGFQQNDWALTALFRVSPVLPFSLTNLLLPALNIRLSVFLLAGCIGMLPRTLFSLWLGIQAKDIEQLLLTPSSNWLALALTALLTALSVSGIFYILQRVISRINAQEINVRS